MGHMFCEPLVKKVDIFIMIMQAIACVCTIRVYWLLLLNVFFQNPTYKIEHTNEGIMALK